MTLSETGKETLEKQLWFGLSEAATLLLVYLMTYSSDNLDDLRQDLDFVFEALLETSMEFGQC